MFSFKQAAVAVVMMAGVAGSADADTVYFSFYNDPSLGNVAGRVTGEILGLSDNATSAATSVVIDSYPAALSPAPASNYATPFDALTWAGAAIFENSFTVANGKVTAANLSIFNGNTSSDDLFLNSTVFGNGVNFLSIGNGDTAYVWNNGGVGTSGVEFSALNAAGPVPELATWGMMLLGFGAVALRVGARKSPAQA